MSNLLLYLFWSLTGISVPCLNGQLQGVKVISYGLLIGQTSGQLSTTQVSPLGTFQLCTLLNKNEPIDVLLYRGPGSDTLYLGTVAPDMTAPVTLVVPAPLRTNIFGYLVCPKCHRADKTAAIIYGDAPLVRRVVANGDTSYTSLIGRKLYAGCIDNGTKGYCSRDRIKF